MGRLLKLLALAALILNHSVLAQSTVKASATVSASLVNGLSLSNSTGNLTFGDIILTSSGQTKTISPSSGVAFDVTGFPNKNITISFSNISLTNDVWVTKNGGAKATLLFSPEIHHTEGSNNYITGISIVSGNSVKLANAENGMGKLYLWLGGSLTAAEAQADGDYSGSFAIDIAY